LTEVGWGRGVEEKSMASGDEKGEKGECGSGMVM
jgi:hypothetical protein